jgi:flagellar L-ring protein precursor FlgH
MKGLSMQKITRHALLMAALLGISACGSTIDKLSKVGDRPPLSPVENPKTKHSYTPITWPLPEPQPTSIRTANSLWQPGARTFFRDQRASRVGDILRVNIEINDQAKLDNTTERSRTSREDIRAPSVIGLQGRIDDLIPFTKDVDPATLFDITGDSSTEGEGKINRRERINTQVAVLITQVLPNGNLVIDGGQEILVNYEIREVKVSGVIRPEDINSDNTIESTQIAQARIVYSGRGQMSDVQQPRWGQQIIEVISPF